MRLVTFAAAGGVGGPRTAAVVGEMVIDLTAAPLNLPATMPELLAQGPSALAAAEQAAASSAPRSPLDQVQLLAPIPRPPKFVAIAFNYPKHIAELDRARPEVPNFFAKLGTWVNDELRQDGITADMLFSCWEQVEHLSTACTLEPGDVICTGTPAGVGASFDPPRWLRPGDEVRVAIDGLGELSNPIVAQRRHDAA